MQIKCACRAEVPVGAGRRRVVLLAAVAAPRERALTKIFQSTYRTIPGGPDPLNSNPSALFEFFALPAVKYSACPP